MGVRFAIVDWTALAPGLAARTDWQAWSRAPQRPEGALEAKLDAMPAMQRRRLNPLGRAAAQAAWDCHSPDGQTPVVFASGYGDAQRCLQLLKEFAASGEASPTDFALSVHNAIGAMYSIARGDGASYSSVAAGAASAAAGVLEACALLAQGASEVLLVCYESPLPGEYGAFEREPQCPYAWAWRIAPAQDGRPHFSLAWTDAADADSKEAVDGDGLPFGLESLRFAISSDAQLCARAEGTRWTWSRHA
ncbi:beta-ketoacyl synthase chain length factor [Ramlibacter henchirensis]|nr:beta-ketoacyl synthase chain length factor [Ramlibacter henchirensis]